MQQVKLSSWLIWLIAGIFYLFEFIHRVIISVMIPELMDSFSVSLSTVGQLSACYFYAYAIAQIPVGMLLDRYKINVLLTFACLLITIGSFIFSATTSMLVANLCRIIIGFGSAFAFVGCLKLGAFWFPTHKFGYIVGLTNLLGVTGAVLGGKPMADAVDMYGWRDVMLTSGAIGLVLALLLWLIVKQPKIKLTSAPILITNVIAVLKCKQTWLISAFGGFMVAPITTYSELWGVSFLINNYNLDKPSAAQITTLTFIGIAIGGPTIGWLSDHYRQRKAPMLLGAFGALACISLILYGPTLPLWCVYLLHIAFGFFTSSMLLCYSLASEMVATNIRATTIALTNSIIMGIGALLQTISGNLLDYSSSDYNVGFMPLIACYSFAFVCFCFMGESNCRVTDSN